MMIVWVWTVLASSLLRLELRRRWRRGIAGSMADDGWLRSPRGGVDSIYNQAGDYL